MRFRLLAQTLLSAGAALASPFAQLPSSSFPDTEVSTNVPFLFRRDHAGRFNFALDFNATPSNNVEVAFGSDLDADGVLQPRETALSFAWDCGQWILVTARKKWLGLDFSSHQGIIRVDDGTCLG